MPPRLHQKTSSQRRQQHNHPAADTQREPAGQHELAEPLTQPDSVLSMQRTIGNQATMRLLNDGAPPDGVQREESTDAKGAKLADEGKLEGDAFYEQIAHVIAYRDLTVGQVIAGQKGGPQYKVEELLGDGSVDNFRAVGLVPAEEYDPTSGKDKEKFHPILAFRGTQPTKATDLLTDTDMGGVGYNYFQRHRKEIAAWLATHADAKSVVTGHSLGGALAQMATTYFPSLIHRTFTYSAPGVSSDTAEIAENQQKRLGDKMPGTQHYITQGDLVTKAGDTHIPGKMTKFTPDKALNPLAAHSLSFLHPEAPAGKTEEVQGHDVSHGGVEFGRVVGGMLGAIPEYTYRAGAYTYKGIKSAGRYIYNKIFGSGQVPADPPRKAAAKVIADQIDDGVKDPQAILKLALRAYVDSLTQQPGHKEMGELRNMLLNEMINPMLGDAATVEQTQEEQAERYADMYPMM